MSVSTIQSTNSLQDIKDSSIGIISLAKNLNFGLPVISSCKSTLSTEERVLLDLYRQNINLKLQLIIKQVNLNSEAAQDALNQLDKTQDEEFDIDKLMAKVNILSNNFLLQQKVLELSIEALPILRATNHNHNITQQESSLIPLLSLRDRLASEICQEASYISTQRQELVEKQRDNFSLHKKNRILTGKLIKITDEYEKRLKSKNDQVSNSQLHVRLEMEREELLFQKQKNIILCEFLTGLICATKIDWSSDPLLTDIILDCGENTSNGNAYDGFDDD
ncbi:hypothetical protein NADFUDRAFT_81121 [Nadsonia fulvescens var. elongata DSM 6958]|uniref:Centromere protein H C-terminal domain-containing protein n=1 Tax=Nadsonia fulvescens var. elongata DSM 6958 TaxID=857566 RepID=A0A1E3PRI1_9ASCO|nr:hypothetical protein NADFUDRAFT_81121 [Nadsonia fulvescens var. elongata DSM 6958]